MDGRDRRRFGLRGASRPWQHAAWRRPTVQRPRPDPGDRPPQLHRVLPVGAWSRPCPIADVLRRQPRRARIRQVRVRRRGLVLDRGAPATQRPRRRPRHRRRNPRDQRRHERAAGPSTPLQAVPRARYRTAPHWRNHDERRRGGRAPAAPAPGTAPQDQPATERQRVHPRPGKRVAVRDVGGRVERNRVGRLRHRTRVCGRARRRRRSLVALVQTIAARQVRIEKKLDQLLEGK